MPVNDKWHKENPKPAKTDFEARMVWKMEHAKNCDCSSKLKLAKSDEKKNQ